MKSVKEFFANKSPLDLRDLLADAYKKIAELERKNRELEKKMSKFSTQNAQARQQIKSLRGQLSAERAKVQSLQQTIKTQKVKARKERIRLQKRAEAAETEVKAIKTAIKALTPKLTKDQLFEMYRSSNFNRFGERIQMVIEISPEKLAEMKQHMATGDSQKLRDMIRFLGLRSTWYDSDAEWNSSEVTRGDEKNLYQTIMVY